MRDPQWGPVPERSWHPVLKFAVVSFGALVLVALLLGLFTDTEEEITPAEREEYERRRAECMVIATEQLDTRFYRVGGNEWVDLVNDCMVKKASD